MRSRLLSTVELVESTKFSDLGEAESDGTVSLDNESDDIFGGSRGQTRLEKFGTLSTLL